MPNKRYNIFHESSNMDYIKKDKLYQFKYIFINFTFD